MQWELHIEKLSKGEVVTFHPSGNSMTPRIKSGEKVTVSPDISNLKVDDIVLCRVKGKYFLHLIKAEKGGRYLIGNNHGYTNGWASAVYGVVVKVEK